MLHQVKPAQPRQVPDPAEPEEVLLHQLGEVVLLHPRAAVAQAEVHQRLQAEVAHHPPVAVQASPVKAQWQNQVLPVKYKQVHQLTQEKKFIQEEQFLGELTIPVTFRMVI